MHPSPTYKTPKPPYTNLLLSRSLFVLTTIFNYRSQWCLEKSANIEEQIEGLSQIEGGAQELGNLLGAFGEVRKRIPRTPRGFSGRLRV